MLIVKSATLRCALPVRGSTRDERGATFLSRSSRGTFLLATSNQPDIASPFCLLLPGDLACSMTILIASTLFKETLSTGSRD